MAYVHTTRVGRWNVVDSEVEPQTVNGIECLSAEQLERAELRAASTVLRSVALIGGAELRFARKALGLRQAELAESLGVTAETVSRWENGGEPFKRSIQLAALALVEMKLNHGSIPRPVNKASVEGGELRVSEA